jgi:hypothetical protein
MRRIQILAILAVFATLALGAPRASAAMFGAEVYGAFNTHSMKEVNNEIDALNGQGANMNNITSGATGGINLRVSPIPSFMISAGWEPLFLSTKDKSGSNLEENLQTNVISATGAYFLPVPGPAKFGFGAGVGYYLLGGEVKDPNGVFSLGIPNHEDVTGHTAGFHVLGMAEFGVSPGFGITAAAGYRNAKITEFEVNGQTQNGDIDYSGFIGRIGLAFSVPGL